MTLILNGTDNSATTPAVTGTDTDTGVFFPTANEVAIATAATERLRINSAGNLTVGKTDITTTVDGFAVLSSGETRISCSANDVLNLNRNTSNGAIQRFFRSGSLVGLIEGATTGLTYTGINGLTFTATQTASADANTLDDYEEGTWTPILKGTSTNPSYTTSSASGSYVKVGRMVYVSFIIIVTAVSSQGTGNIYMDALPFTVNDESYGPTLTIMYNDTWDVDFRAMYASGISWTMRPIGVTQSNATWGGSSALSTGFFSGSGCYLTS